MSVAGPGANAAPAGAARRDDLQIAVGGTTLAAWHYVPPPPARGLCVVMAHGFCGTRDAGLVGFGHRLAAAGFDVLCFDYRGFGASGGMPRQDVHPARQREDYAAAIATARRLPGVERVVIWGTSLSGGHVFALAAERGDLAGAIAMTPAADPSRSGRHQRVGPRAAATLLGALCRDAARAARGKDPVMLRVVGAPGSPAVLTTPDAEPGYRRAAAEAPLWRNAFTARTLARVPRYRPARHAERITCPMLVQVGAADLNAPPEVAAAAARRAGADLREYEGVAHFDVYDTGSAFDAVVSDQVEFLTGLA